MFLESFRHLIEIEAIKKQIDSITNAISQENKRISDLEDRRNKIFLGINDLKNTQKALGLEGLQYQIEDWQIRLNKLTSQLSMSVTEKEQLAFESQISLVKNDIEQTEEKYFLALEESEKIDNQIKDDQTFLEGSKKTLEEIKAEVATSLAKHEKMISDNQARIDSLLDQCHPSVKSLFLETQKKFRPKNSVAFLLDRKCASCNILVDQNMKANLEKGLTLETCPSCGRLLIPDSATLYS